MDKQYYRLFGGILALALIIFGFYFFTFSSVIANEGYEKGGHILFIDKSNPQILILKQQYLTGAWDSESTYSTARKNIGTGEIESIDTTTIDKHQWVKIKVSPSIWDSRDRGFFGPERFKEFFADFHNKGLLQFKLSNLSSFKDLKLPETELPKIVPHWSAYCDNTFSNNFRAYVFCINGALILNTVGKDFSLIDEIVLMQKDEDKDYTYLLYTDFKDANHFTVTQKYETFEPGSDGKPKTGTTDEVTVVKHYRISNKGEIRRSSQEQFGAISVNHSKM